MDQQVSALVVVRSNGDHLQRTLRALAAQTRRPDTIVVVDCTRNHDALDRLEDRDDVRVDSVVRTDGAATFPEAVGRAEKTVATEIGDNDWLWLLGHDTAPEPGALDALLAAVETSPSVAVAGPKIVDWDDETMLTEFGQTLSPLGATLYPVDHELDQAQHDRLSDVLGVSPSGMIVRHHVWRALGGLDRALARVDSGLDLSVRARLAGYRVVLVPAARVAEANDGVAHGRRRASTGHVGHYARRSAQLHRRLVYAPLALVPLHWLSLLPLAILRCLWALVQKRPSRVPGEVAAAFVVAWRGVRVIRARRRLARGKRMGWARVNALRMSAKQARRLRMLRRDDAAEHGTDAGTLDFFSASGVWVVVVLAAVSLGLTYSLVGDASIHHGALAPLSRIGQLWHNAFWGWRDALGGPGSADPFAFVVALLGSITFWNPSLAIVLLVVAAVPLAGMGAWFLAARLTERRSVRIFFALAWGLAPPLLSALGEGRPGAVVAHIALVWLVFAGLGAARSASAAATTSLLAAVVAAGAPSLIPALTVLWLAAMALSGRRALRLLGVPVATVVLFAPLAWQQIARHTPWALAADPGAPTAAHGGTGWLRALGFPDGLGQGPSLVESLFGLADLTVWPGTIVTTLLLIPLGLLAVVGVVWGRWRAALVCGLLIVIGALTGAVAAGTSVALSGASAVQVWPGAGVSLYWLGAAGAAGLGLVALRRGAAAGAFVALVTALIAVVPLAGGTMASLRHAHDAAQGVPAIVEAQAQKNPHIGVLALTPRADDAFGVRLLRGGANTLDAQSTLAATRLDLGVAEESRAELAANLASPSGLDPRSELSAQGIGFVLVRPAPDDDQARAAATRASAALDANSALTPIGDTPSGTLWAYPDGAEAAAEPTLTGADAALRAAIIAGQLTLLGLTLIVALPTGRRDPLRRRPR